ncbi:sugar ABC transporter ATP-binding protein [Saccharospirillum salsuginis]|uniref:ABC transporter ATP-binding protein n=1 Tax=Saccharospirillum salsuginis TaxID=418750 RepID=A0A918N5T1_9GAMM|nr:sugar ABC transporter ATP-binding protein [Saccharospirillum salsuginis]GGX43179.1 ABC transporter ATP-binding protein [Saccharospirillum salsuginis]
MTDQNNPPLLSIEGVHKSFPGVRALDNVSLTLNAGEIHALLGENGAGKSTLIKVLTGIYVKDSGSLVMDGKPVHIHDSLDAQKHGIRTVYQEINLIPTMTVAENLTLLDQPKRMGLISWRSAESRAREMLRRVGLDIDLRSQLDSHSVAIQQMVAIARALGSKARILILDEPTASLDSQEIARLFELMRQLKSEGMGIIFVTHFLDQVYDISDTISVLRNGCHVGTFKTEALSRSDLVSHMLGKDLDTLHHEQSDSSLEHGNRQRILSLKQVGRRNMLNPLDLDLHQGEVVGLAGLLGSGRTEVCQLAFGAKRPDQGRKSWLGTEVSINTPKQAIAQGMAYCPEDRKHHGIVAELSVRENLILALQSARGWWSPMPMSEQKAIVDEFIQRLNIKTPHMEKPIGELSGGNQQKVILARWLITQPKLLILDEPTRGIDVGAHHEIIQIIKDLCGEGMSLLVASSEVEEIVAFAHRVAVMRDRTKVAEVSGDRISQKSIIQAIAQ